MKYDNSQVDIILDVLERAREAFPASIFINSLLGQYRERGGLSKKQLEGLLSKASKIQGMNAARLATLEAIIKSKPSRYKSTVTKAISEPIVDDSAEKVREILQKYPQHKRVLYFKMKLDKRDILLPAERAELEKFHKLIM